MAAFPPIPKSWHAALADETEKDYFHALARFVAAERAEHTVCPPESDVFNALALTPKTKVKAVILGQDPYPTPGVAHGLAFSVQPGARIPGSLRNIFKELVADLGVPMPTSGDLTPWADRGVMLLNRVLTVGTGKPASHRGTVWEPVTDRAIAALVERGGPLVAILWGRDAQTLTPALGRVPVVASAHPSPLSAYAGFFGSRPFSKVNALLEAQGTEPVDWSLP